MMFLRDDSGPFYMPANERLKIKEDDLENFKFAIIQKNKLLKEIFAVENWTGKEVIIVCGKKFIVNTTKKGLDAQDSENKFVSEIVIHELFERKGIDYDVRDSHGALVQKLLSESDVDVTPNSPNTESADSVCFGRLVS